MDGTYTVSQLSDAVARLVARAFPDELWVEGEIRNLSRSRNGHVYFTLVDPGVDLDVAPSLPVTLFASDRDAVNRVLMRSGAMRMTDGVHVRIRGRLNHYAARGSIQLRMTWIDTDFTVGRLAAERRELLNKLGAAGLLDRNSSRPVPTVPLRIGLITSIGSAAHADFVTELERTGHAYRLLVVDTPVQGIDAPELIAAALRRLASTGAEVVAVVRGGGAQTDLAAFDAEVVATAIAHAPFPVFTGIGHEIDMTVADHVAAQNFKTPTACAHAVAAIVHTFDRRLSEMERSVATAGLTGAHQAQRRLERTHVRLAATTRIQLMRHGEGLGRRTAQLEQQAGRAVVFAERRIGRLRDRSRSAVAAVIAGHGQAVEDTVRRLRASVPRAVAEQERVVNGLDALRRVHEPERMLARGWSVTYGGHARLVRSPLDVATGETLRTQTAGGAIWSTVGDTTVVDEGTVADETETRESE